MEQFRRKSKFCNVTLRTPGTYKELTWVLGTFFIWKEGGELSANQLTKYSIGQIFRNLANLGFSEKTLHLNLKA